jgi:Mg2+/Co2+ transporter CorB
LGLGLSLAVLAALVAFAALVAAAETALTAVARARLRPAADRGDPAARRVLALAEDGERLAGALLLAHTLAGVVAAAVAALTAARLHEGWAVPALLAVLTLVLIALAEVLPRALAIARPEAVALRLSGFAAALVAVLAPVMAAIRGAVGALLWAFGQRENPEARLTAIRDEIAGAIAQGHSEGAVEKAARDRMLGAFDLGERTVEEVMRHRSQVEMIDADRPPTEILTQALASPHTRLPVFRDSDENILGVVHAKDLLREVDRLVRGAGGDLAALDGLDVVKLAMKPYFVPETTPLDEQMRAFLARRTHFALVVDEYGGLQGLVTLEDILEEIVGDITDEFDVVDRGSAPRPTEAGDYLMDGAMTIRDANRLLDWALPDDEANTLAGLVIHEAQTIPQEGQVFAFHGFRFEVVQRRENRLVRLKLRPL